MFNPDNYDTFTYESYSFNADSGTVSLHYELGEFEFTETFSFPTVTPPDPKAFDDALKLLHLMAGFSYYKVAAPKTVQIKYSVSELQKQLLTDLFENGMAEFAFVNNLGILSPRIIAEIDNGQSSSSILIDHGVIPVGGGKDSIVTIEAARQVGIPLTLLSVRSYPPIEKTMEVANLPAVVIDRTIDPQVVKLQAEGGHSGHVPATAVISAVAIAYAIQQGYSSVIMSNEKSASYGNIEIGGRTVNHQYSKSLEFEKQLNVWAKELNPSLNYFSLLRPFSELAIASKFATLTQYHRAFLSCNKAFKLEQSQRATTWCGECPKCLFVFLALANFMDKKELVSIFGTNLLDQESDIPKYKELCGLENYKPFECIGEIDECAAAIVSLTAEWENGS